MSNSISTLIHKQQKPRIRVEHFRQLPATPATPALVRARALLRRFLSRTKILRTASIDGIFAYPATRLAKLPWQKLLLRFADECLVITLGIMLVGFNIFISHSNLATRDNSILATALSRHSSKNPALYSKLFATTTTVSPSGFILEARAHEQLTEPKLTQIAGSSASLSALTSIDEQGLSAAIPDSIQSLLDNQIRVYETRAGDTLASIAANYDIDVNTIEWSNNLTSDVIKPGWFLVIPPVKGVLVKADEDTSIPSIARKFKCSEERIISFNGLDGADNVEAGKYIMCPDGVVPAPPQSNPRKTNLGKSPSRAIGISYASIPDIKGTTNSFVAGNCTWYVAKKMKISFRGNANRWYKNAPAAGYKTGSNPVAGSAVVTSNGGRYGHVGFVESVNADGTFNISEMNYEGLFKITHRTLSASDVVGFIYPMD